MTLALVLQTMLAVLATGVGAACVVLARRLRRLNDLESGLGGAIAVMTAEIARLESGMQAARAEATAATRALAAEIERAKGERAFWVMQQQFGADRPARRALRRRRTEETSHG